MYSIAYLHIALAHFPIALLVTATGMDWYGALRKRPAMPTTPLLAIGVIGAWLALVTGWLNRNWQWQNGLLDTPELRSLAGWHQWTATAASVLFSLVLGFRVCRKRSSIPRWQFVAQGVGLILLIVATHLGGTLAHGES